MGLAKSNRLSWVIGAGIVGADIGTSVFYSTGLLFPKVGYLAPFFILFVCLMMWLFKRTYEEGIGMSPYNGGAYVMVLRTIGRRAAVLVGSLTVLSYLATAAVSSLAGAHYITSLSDGHSNSGTIVLLSFIPIITFGLLNIRGIKEPAKIVTTIAATHFGLLIIMGIWSGFYLLTHDIQWSKMITHMPKDLGTAAILHGFAAAFLGITGFESAAQIVEELQEPLNETVKKLYRAVVILVSLSAPVISFMCLAVLTHDEVLDNRTALLSGLANKIGGRTLLLVLVFDATLTLFAAVNTAYVGFIGLATTMAKQGNLPQMLLTRLAHKFPSIQGYPFIALPFMFIAMFMTGFAHDKDSVLEEVYGMAFLAVMVSFALGVVLMRNRSLRKDVERGVLSQLIINFKGFKIPVIPMISGITLAAAQLLLLYFSEAEAKTMLLEILGLVLLLMAFYRWGVLEERLEKRNDLRLGLGRFSENTNLPVDLPTYVVCAGGTGARRLINTSIKKATKLAEGKAFEVIVFHAEENKDPEGFFFELLQRVVSQQVAPIYQNKDMIVTVKILPGNLAEGLMTLKKTHKFDTLMLGIGRNKDQVEIIRENLEQELEVNVIPILN
ncbi:MAG: APC family permease [Bdellovibrionales bacterium]